MLLEWHTVPPNGDHPLFASGRDAIYRVSTRRMAKCFAIFSMGSNHEPSGKMLESTPLIRALPQMDRRAWQLPLWEVWGFPERQPNGGVRELATHTG
jgi:hypothetical protein